MNAMKVVGRLFGGNEGVSLTHRETESQKRMVLPGLKYCQDI